MSSSIEERAEEYVEKHRSVEACYFTPAGSYSYHAERVAYAVGATEQKAIDDAKLLKLKSSWEKQAQINHDDEANYKQGYHDAIEKACDWLKKNFEYYVDVEVSSYYTYEDKLVEDFRKAMEE